MTDTLTTPRISDPALDEGEPIFTHIVVVGEGESAEELVSDHRSGADTGARSDLPSPGVADTSSA